MLLRRERLAKGGQDEVELSVGEQLVLDSLAIALEAGGLEACVVQEFPNRTCAATVCPPEEEQLQGALVHPLEEHWCTASAPVEELDARKRVAIASFHINAIERDMRLRLCHWSLDCNTSTKMQVSVVSEE